MTELKTRRGVVLYKENPFLVDASVKTKKVSNSRGDMMLIHSQTGEIQSPVAGFWEIQEVDATKFVKLFVRGVKALKELTGTGTKVFEYLYLQVQENIGKDKLFLSFQAVDQIITPMSESVYFKGMSELIKKEFIAPSTVQGIYWLNPSFIWNGDRLAFIHEIRKSNKPKAKAKDTLTGNLFNEIADAS